MSAALLLSPIFAVLSTPPPTAGISPAAAPDVTPSPVQIHDIAPPIDVFPYPPWMVATAIAVAVILLGLVIWFIVSLIRRRPPPPPPSASEIALRELEKLRTKVGEIEPYAFSVVVSDVLRTFIANAKFSLPATRQTSPEFLAAISGSKLFNESDRSLLGHFLEKCDMIKFARMDATSADNSELVESALAFVQGGQA
ncbi:hypothetical protein CfE428DRAFT_3458 [Chthoniobacter flavus Ellin428]|uniref:DUF4381 domain-containing protein n=1 Tax=Chthoniobacter flavus Ellin428 TaxID=497964 RepID=B4D3H0_9BACT|nr:DUF4381 family protein [Chthoniobacter flavus]EDY18800.1 hypothetical protein CfE428DRAFT_3458 [Chthoniobacter flavus Ellin428]TCO93397.1 uncharacterized protein DUF4381 [Chthoniobacter flavus]